MNRLKLNQSKIPNLVVGLTQLLANYQQYHQRLNVYLKKGNYKNFRELHQHFKALYRKTSEDIKDIVSRLYILNYSPKIEFQKCLKGVEDVLFSDAQNILLMVESIVNFHKILVSNMQSVIRKAEMANDKNSISLISRLLQYLEIQSWVLGLWIDMYIEILSQRFSLSHDKREYKLYPNNLVFRRIDLLKYLGN